MDVHNHTLLTPQGGGGGVTPIDSIITDATSHSQSVVKAAQKVIVSGQSGSEIPLKYDRQWVTPID